MAELKNNIFNNNIAGDTSNILIPDSSGIKSGVVFKSNINSNILNGYYNLLSKAIQYLQFTCGLYNQEAYYNEGNIASLIIKNGNNYSIWQFRRNSNNPQVLNNNPPITGASITTINGIDIYEGGTLNTDWDKLTQNYNVEAISNTVMIRDEVGASNINMPANIKNTTVVNNEYLEEQLQSSLSTKQNKLTAGINVEITENNVINVKGDVATDANLVTQTNEALGDNVQTALDILFNRYNIPLYFTVYPEDDGTFDDKKRPANYFKRLYNITTTWKKRFATTGAFERHEGGFANESRSGLIQPYAMKRLRGNFYGVETPMGDFGVGGITHRIYREGSAVSSKSNNGSVVPRTYVGIDSDSVSNSSDNEGRSTNILKETWELKTINGVSIWN
ncbi:hypothetical protein [uncultured Brachyspira sp.]|uniref:hypothetical protein n=1 Tax=uncultured Brachyspira sp. TaxID=221953 RepID=UPI0032208B90